MGISAGIGVLGVLGSPLIALLYRERALQSIALVLFLMLPLATAGIFPSAILARRMEFGKIALVETCATLVGSISAVAFALSGLGFWSIVFGQIVSTMVGLAVSFPLARWLPALPRASVGALSDLSFGGAVTLSNLANFVISASDNWIVGITAGRVAVGLYDRSYRLVVQPISQLLVPIGRTAVPLLSRLADRPGEYRRYYIGMVRVVLTLTLPVSIFCITQAAAIIKIVLGPKWVAAEPIFTWISVGGLASGFYASLSWLFISQGRTREMAMFTGIAAAVNIATFIIGAFWGVVGVAALAAIGFLSISTPLMVLGATRSGPVKSADLIGLLLSYGGVSGVIAASASSLRGPIAEGGLLGLISGCMFCIAGMIILPAITPGHGREVRSLYHAGFRIGERWSKRAVGRILGATRSRSA